MKLGLLCFILISPLFSRAEVSPLAKDLYKEGVAAYQKKDWAAAKKAFEGSLQLELSNPLTLYNLGLAEYQQQNLGRALGAWRSALSVRSGFKEAQRAIDLTLKQMPQVLSPKGFMEESSVKFLISWFSFYPSALISAVLIMLGVSLVLRYFGRRKRAALMGLPQPSYPVEVGLLLVCWVLIMALAFLHGMSQAGDRATVIAPQAKLRLSPSVDGIVIGEVLEGVEVKVKRRSEKWVQVVTSNNFLGWLNQSVLWSGGLKESKEEEEGNNT